MTKHTPVSIVKQALGLAMEQGIPVLLVLFAFMTLPIVWADLNLDEDDAFRISGIIGLVALVPQILVTEISLSKHGLIETQRDGRRGFFARAFGQSLLYGLAVIAGLLLLIIPGLIVAARWSISLPVLIARNEGAVDALRSSWNLTKDHFWLCLGAIILALVPALCSLVLIFLTPMISPLAESLLFESLTTISIIFLWFVSIALYAAITKSENMA